jgi:hypothetical protein
MKYQHILNNEVLFESNDASEFMLYLLTNDKAKQAKYSILYNLLEQSKEYICNMVSAKSSTDKV